MMLSRLKYEFHQHLWEIIAKTPHSPAKIDDIYTSVAFSDIFQDNIAELNPNPANCKLISKASAYQILYVSKS